MSLCRYLPVPSDRMGIIWSLLSVKDSIILEYGPAGTTHFSMGFYGTLGVARRLTPAMRKITATLRQGICCKR